MQFSQSWIYPTFLIKFVEPTVLAYYCSCENVIPDIQLLKKYDIHFWMALIQAHESSKPFKIN